MSDQLTPARLRALIAAATPGPWEFRSGVDSCDNSVDLLMGQVGQASKGEDEEWDEVLFSAHAFGETQVSANWELITELVNNAPALADALEAEELLEWILAHCDITRTPGSFEARSQDAIVPLIARLRAAKEAAQST